MVRFGAICLFCEDVRQERDGQDTLIGVFPDNLHIKAPSDEPTPPNAVAHIPRMGFYLRAYFEVDGDLPASASARIMSSVGVQIADASWEPSTIQKAFDDARGNEMPLAGLIFKVVAGPIPISHPRSKITALLTIDGVEQVVGALNLMFPNASEQPSEQSPSAS